MKIVILGAGQVGSTVAWSLSGENNDITIVDTDNEQLRWTNTSASVQTLRVQVYLFSGTCNTYELRRTP